MAGQRRVIAADLLRVRRPRVPVPCPPSDVIGVYRQENAAIVVRALRGLPASWKVRMWALDREAPALAEVTVGSGGGGRFELLNRLIDRGGSGGGRWLVVIDDDVVVQPGLPSLVHWASRAGFGLAMPGHRAASFHTWRFTRRNLFDRARATTFVEIGPVLAISPGARELVLPFPADTGLGWGVEARWWQLAQQGAVRLGIVDSVPTVHLRPPGRSYDREVEGQRLHAELDRVRVPEGTARERMELLQHNLGHWRRWRRVPPTGPLWPSKANDVVPE